MISGLPIIGLAILAALEWDMNSTVWLLRASSAPEWNSGVAKAKVNVDALPQNRYETADE